MLKIKSSVWLVLLFGIGFSAACGLGEQTDEANKLVDEANIIIEKYNEPLAKSNELFTELFGDNLIKVTNIQAYKKENKAKFDELTKLLEEVELLGNQSVEKFEQASRLKLNEKYKEYLNFKTQEIKKRYENNKFITSLVKSSSETNDIDKWNKLIEDYNEKSVVFTKEIDELEKKAAQITKENPTLFNSK